MLGLAYPLVLIFYFYHFKLIGKCILRYDSWFTWSIHILNNIEFISPNLLSTNLYKRSLCQTVLNALRRSTKHAYNFVFFWTIDFFFISEQKYRNYIFHITIPLQKRCSGTLNILSIKIKRRDWLKSIIVRPTTLILFYVSYASVYITCTFFGRSYYGFLTDTILMQWNIANIDSYSGSNVLLYVS